MDFLKKNDIIVKEKKPEHFDADLKLFKERCPGSPLHAELRRLNTFNKPKIHGLILMELLDKVSEEELLKNRLPADTTGNPEGTGEGNNDPADTTGNPEGTGEDKSDPADTTGNPEGTGEGNTDPADTTGNPEGTGEGNTNPADTTGNPEGTGDDKSDPADKTKKGTVKKKGTNKKSSPK
ncbi:MAG: hypothetical protein VB046_08255 [Paludibacter sp.]|nr:hypothetical protein [Paludibacter sp.]